MPIHLPFSRLRCSCLGKAARCRTEEDALQLGSGLIVMIKGRCVYNYIEMLDRCRCIIIITSNEFQAGEIQVELLSLHRLCASLGRYRRGRGPAPSVQVQVKMVDIMMILLKQERMIVVIVIDMQTNKTPFLYSGSINWQSANKKLLLCQVCQG